MFDYYNEEQLRTIFSKHSIYGPRGTYAWWHGITEGAARTDDVEIWISDFYEQYNARFGQTF